MAALPPNSPLIPLQIMLKMLMEAALPSVVSLKTFFPASENGEFEKCCRVGAGVVVNRTRILTSAHVVGMISTVPDSESSSTLKNCLIGRTVAITTDNKVLKTKLLAVDFSGDVAVLEAEGYAEGDLPPPMPVARSVASKELPLLVITRHEGCDGCGLVQMKVRAVEDNSPRTEWPYAIVDGHEWARYGGAPDDNMKIVPGSPWFSLGRQVVGIASRATGGEEADSIGGFVVPPPRLRSVLHYAKTKAPGDPVALDRWINNITFADCDNNEEMESFGNVDTASVMTMYLDY